MKKVFGYKVYEKDGELFNFDMSKVRIQGKKNATAFVLDDADINRRVKVDKLFSIIDADKSGFVEVEGVNKAIVVNSSGDVFSLRAFSLVASTR
jgi:hypothetical protein